MTMNSATIQESVITNKLRELRQSRGLPVLGLAVKAKVSSATLSAIENWGHTPRLEVQSRIASVLGVSPADIWPVEEVADVAEATATKQAS